MNQTDTKTKAQEFKDDLDPMTPVLIGAGQFLQLVPDALSPVEIAAHAAKAALQDARQSSKPESLTDHIDLIAAVRNFSDSSPAYSSPFGRSENFPLSVANRIGAKPTRLIYEVIGGQSPQKLIRECCDLLATGACSMALIVGGEALGNMKAAQSALRKSADTGGDVSPPLNWAEAPSLPDGVKLDDRGFGDVSQMISASEVNHGLFDPMLYYGFMETAYRKSLGLSLEAYTQKMADCLSPLSKVAEDNSFSMFRESFSAAELSRHSPRNRQLTTPYLKHMVAKDGVNQGAAVILTTVGKAHALKIPREHWVFLHGAAETQERLLLERAELGRSEALTLCLAQTLARAEVAADEISHLDLYSCFPVVLFNSCEALGIGPNDPRSLTQTGGLPFFGGPGNNYSLHAVASLMTTLRANPDEYGLVHGNGGWMSKHAAGLYSCRAPKTAWTVQEGNPAQDILNAVPPHAHTDRAEGRATVESYIVIYARGEPLSGLIIGKLDGSGERFYARASLNSKSALEDMARGLCLGRPIKVTATPQGNLFEFVTAVFE